jgi:hypothetical protein
MSKKFKKQVRHLLKNVWHEPELSLDRTLIGKLTKVRKNCSCKLHSAKHKNEGLTRQEQRSLDELKYFEQYS